MSAIGAILQQLFFAVTGQDEERRRFQSEVRDPELVFRRYFDQIYRYCRVRVKTDSDAEDICSQIFSEAITALPRLKWKGKPVLAFLYTVAGRRIIDHRKRAKPTADIEEVAEPAATTAPVEFLAQKGKLAGAIEDLPEDQRVCVYLQVVQGYSFAEVAKVVDRTEKACKGLVYRGLDAVRAQLEEEGLAPL